MDNIFSRQRGKFCRRLEQNEQERDLTVLNTCETIYFTYFILQYCFGYYSMCMRSHLFFPNNEAGFNI